jgi:hypothetical protein
MSLKKFRALVQDICRNHYFLVDVIDSKSEPQYVDSELLTALTRSIQFKEDHIIWKLLVGKVSSNFIKNLKKITPDDMTSSGYTGVNMKLHHLDMNGNIASTVILHNIKYDSVNLEDEEVNQEGTGVSIIGINVTYTVIDID